jgi:hypothetical protein
MNCVCFVQMPNSHLDVHNLTDIMNQALMPRAPLPSWHCSVLAAPFNKPSPPQVVLPWQPVTEEVIETGRGMKWVVSKPKCKSSPCLEYPKRNAH